MMQERESLGVDGRDGPSSPDSASRIDLSQPVSVRVARALADAKDVEATELEPPLYEAVDLEALDRLCGSAGARTSVRVVFSVDGYEVTVTATDDVQVRELV